MKVIIDATNIKTGGGFTHLSRLLQNNQNTNFEIEIIGGKWIQNISSEKNITKIIFNWILDTPIIKEIFKLFFLRKYLSKSDVAFVPGGTFSDKNISYVTMSQNMLVFEKKERNRFPLSLTKVRYLLLEKIQLKSFENSKGIIYISTYAKNYIENMYPHLKKKKTKVIYHGISDEFRQKPKEQKCIQNYTNKKPYIITYVSIINYYKHQWNVIESVKQLRRLGYNIHLELIGPINNSVKNKFYQAMKGCESFVFYRGKIPYESISAAYKNADLFIFASTCENMPNILVEAMSAGLPILCSHYGPMPEILKDAGIYIDPTSVNSITENLKLALDDKDLRFKISKKAYNYSKNFSWSNTSEQTFEFLKNINNLS